LRPPFDHFPLWQFFAEITRDFFAGLICRPFA